MRFCGRLFFLSAVLCIVQQNGTLAWFWPTGPCTDSTCVLSQWSVWSSCTLTCGFGLTTRTRSVSTRQSCTGSPCNDRRTEIQSCYPRCCPVNCRWENWLTWSSCSTSCGGGVQTRARNYARVASCGGTCVGESEETRACNTACCPVDCVWDSWASYGTCSASCGGGRQGRERVILVNAACGGRQCSGPETESRTCNDLNCPRNCLWEMWEAWGDCSVTCGGGVQYRRRRVNLQAIHGGSACMGSSVMSRYCNSECCPVNCRWGSWNSWSDCSKSCENGTRQRTRNFAVEGACGGTACIGMNTSVETCNQVCCPVHCAWSDWTNWESCSRPCGNGTQSRRRTESISSLCNGDVCAGKANDTRMCNTHCCPVDCVMSEWTTWNACSSSCGANGVKSRTRSIRFYPECGGSLCSNETQQIVSCNRTCMNGGNMTTSECQCSNGWEGECCETDINECVTLEHDCHPNATCKNSVGSYSCVCVKNYEGNGTFCERAMFEHGIQETRMANEVASSTLDLKTIALIAVTGGFALVGVLAFIALKTRIAKQPDVTLRTAYSNPLYMNTIDNGIVETIGNQIHLDPNLPSGSGT